MRSIIMRGIWNSKRSRINYGAARLTALITVLMMVLQLTGVGVQARHPNAVWPLFETEAQQEADGDVEGLIETRKAIIALYDDRVDTDKEKMDVVTPRYRMIAEAYESLLDYDKALEALEYYKYYAQLQEREGYWNHDAVIWAESKIKNMQLDIKLFVKTDDMTNAVYYGAKYEPVAGTYFGAAYDRDTRIIASAGGNSYDWNHVSKYFPKKNSAYLIYLEFAKQDIRDFDRYFQAAKNADTGVELAWNAYETYDDMSDYKSYIQETATYIKNLGVPVFVRYGAEMNIAEGMEDHKEFVENFRYVAAEVRKIAPNAVMLWSPNEITESSRNLEDYYPGDVYVDWVGVSLYTYYYFGDKTDWGNQQEAIDNQFFTGPNANPLSKIQEVVEFIGDRKPIMIAESGVAHYSKVAQEDMTDWAAVQLRRQYDYIPLLYPQVKGIMYFNVDTEVTKRNSYAFYTNDTIHDLYNSLIADESYLSEIGDSAPFRYAEVGSRRDKSVKVDGNSADLKTFVIVPGSLEPTVTYKLNGRILAVKSTLPYDYSLSLGSLSEGIHELTVSVKNDDGVLVKESTYLLTKSSEGTLIEEGTFTERSFDDLGSHWSGSYVLEIAKRGIIVGSDGKFRADDLISRAEMTSIISKLGDLSQDKAVSFNDVSSSAWYYKYVSGAQDYLVGYGSNYYPGRYATREEIITALVKLKGYNVSEVTSVDRTSFDSQFIDAGSVDSANRDYMILAVKYGIVGGYSDGTIRPDANMRRGEVAKVLFTTFY